MSYLARQALPGREAYSMELRQLGFFLGVAESGSFSKAAVRL